MQIHPYRLVECRKARVLGIAGTLPFNAVGELVLSSWPQTMLKARVDTVAFIRRCLAGPAASDRNS